MNSLETTLSNARARLLAERTAAGHWEGELSDSALSTATAVTALTVVDREEFGALIADGVRWLEANQNADGGWGDTVISLSNLSTTLLCWSALGIVAGRAVSAGPSEAVQRAERWIVDCAGSLEPEVIVEKVTERYGRDRTFAVPILMMGAICGRLGEERAAWKRVLALPFELAACPKKWFATLRMPVVSYALPALIAIGHARYFHAPPGLMVARRLRRWAWPRASRLLGEIQPASGGYIEATPLTSFVVMALASSGQRDHPVVREGVRFLLESIREDGSWPIDTNLSTWVTTLAVKALGSARHGLDGIDRESRTRIREWLLGQQFREIHPYTDAPPGGWAWTDLSGGVPDADDTPGALLALRLLEDDESAGACAEAAASGAKWLLGLQNRDGGIPTFCRGWGQFPFDRSSPDLTAHALRAWAAWRDLLDAGLRRRIDRGTARAVGYLRGCQREDGAWEPLWFGNQHVTGDANPVYGTAQVLPALAALAARANPGDVGRDSVMLRRGVQWLVRSQNPDGGWGGDARAPSSIEETGLALSALSCLAIAGLTGVGRATLERGAAYLVSCTQEGTRFPPAPIGFYFAKLWYYEKLYPLVWAVAGLEAARDALNAPDQARA